MKFQQFSSPVMAKGLEDTSFYRYNRLISLNDVGGDPQQFGFSVETFHERIQQRAQVWPHRLLATSTHDTKRSGGSFAPASMFFRKSQALWQEKVGKWGRWNRGHKTLVAGLEAPSRNDEYLLYQTLLGVWSEGGASRAEDGAGPRQAVHAESHSRGKGCFELGKSKCCIRRSNDEICGRITGSRTQWRVP